MKIVRTKLKKFLKSCFVFITITAWFLSGWPQVWQDPSIPPEIKQVHAENVLTNPSFTGNTDGWTLSNKTYDDTTYQDTPGSVQTYAGRRVDTTGTATHNSYISFLESDTVIFSGWWKNENVNNGDITFFAEIEAENDPGNWTEIWSSGLIDATSNDWTNTGNIDVSNYFSTGNYTLRLRVEARGGAAGGSSETGWFDNITLDVTSHVEISISVDPTSFDYGIMNESETKRATEVDPPGVSGIEITNTSSVDVDFDISGDDATGNGQTWILSSTIGENQYVHEFSTDTDTFTNPTVLIKNYTNFAENIGENGWRAIDLRINMPSTVTSPGTQMTAPVTILASQSGS